MTNLYRGALGQFSGDAKLMGRQVAEMERKVQEAFKRAQSAIFDLETAVGVLEEAGGGGAVASVQGSNGITPGTAQTGVVTLSGVDLLPRDGSRAMTGSLDMGSQSITNVNLVDGVALTTAGSATQYLSGTGAYSTPAGAVASVQGSNGITPGVAQTGVVTLSGVDLLPRDGTRAMTGNLDMGGQNLTNVNLVDGVSLTTAGSATTFLNGTGAYSAPVGAVTSVQGSNGITPGTAQTGVVTLSGVDLLPRDGTRAMTADLPMGAFSIANTKYFTQNNQTTGPGSPTAAVSKYSRSWGGRSLPTWKSPDGLVYPVQEFLGQASIGLWKPPGNATTVPGVFGRAAFTTTGTATARNIATTDALTRMKRLGYVSAGAINSGAGGHVAVAQITTGTGTLGGFYKCMRWGNSDAAIRTDAVMFVGVRAITTVIAGGTSPATLVNCIGVGRRSTDTNMFLFYGGSAAQTPVDLGAGFPSNTLIPYELHLYCPPSGAGTLYYELINLSTGGTTGVQSVTGAAGTATPASTTLLCESHFWRSTTAGALAVGIDIISDYTGGNN